MNYKVEGLNDLSKQFHEFQINAGFTDSNITQRLMLVNSEISEAFEAFRKEHYADTKGLEKEISEWSAHDDDYPGLFKTYVKDSFEDEMADAIIRLLAMCAENNIDIEKHIQLKMKYNELRGFKYGGKKF